MCLSFDLPTRPLSASQFHKNVPPQRAYTHIRVQDSSTPCMGLCIVHDRAYAEATATRESVTRAVAHECAQASHLAVKGLHGRSRAWLVLGQYRKSIGMLYDACSRSMRF